MRSGTSGVNTTAAPRIKWTASEPIPARTMRLGPMGSRQERSKLSSSGSGAIPTQARGSNSAFHGFRDTAGVQFNFIKDGECGFQRGEGLRASYARRLARNHALEKLLQLQAQRLVFRHRERRELDGHVRSHAEPCGVLARVIERDVFVRLEEPQLADALRGDAAGSEIGDASARKLKPDIRDIDFGREDGDTGGSNLLRSFTSKRQHDIDVVDHQIQNNVHVQAARAELA